MNGIQPGTPASQLSRQSFKNSNQSGSVQGANNGADILYSDLSSSSLNAVSLNSQLKVIDNPTTTNVLGVSSLKPFRATDNKTIVNSSQPYNFTPPILFVLSVGVICAFVYVKITNKNKTKKAEN